ncbi:aldehyde dehydrogenase family protein [Aquisalimonas sp. 2447]|uniref:aldehyde dehydrogenase family protein n=1 Tax=Aquisalimonas sp. 2447 TaxID=2740807 RepID=UPI001432613A|nr:aldehyde dehydrogenase family protein [Aquisalimonas sp. 2447]QIT56061.1 aldehyde dehydrogenase family protein [Aquisalimonas sp. 2447]
MGELYRNLIDGQWLDGDGTVANVNPSNTEEVIGHAAQATAAQVRDAIAAARAAQPQWAAAGLEQRHRALMGAGAELMERSRELGRELSREEGKPLAEGVGEVYRAGQFFQYYAAEVHRQFGETADSVRPGIEIDIRREPVGVVGIISPWNFPMATAAWKLAPALAFGNAVVFKPANLVPASAWAMVEVLHRHELPPGVVNLVMGRGSSVGEALINSPDIDAISFTGSQDVGRRVARATAANLVRCQLEMGSKNALVIMDDADLDLAVQAAVAGGYSGTGQKCTASSRLVVHEAVHDAFVDKLAVRLEAMTVGPAVDETTEIGPLADAAQLENVEGYIRLAETEGAHRVVGGTRVELDTPGHYLSPCLLTGTDNRMRINQEEAFGPLATVIRVAGIDEAIRVTNDTVFGLTAGIVTGSLSYANRFRREAHAGCVMVNLPTAGTDYHVPFGGRRTSSYGPREQGRYAREFYTTVKTSYVRS